MTIRVDRTVAIARARRLASRVSLCALLCTSLSALSACGQMPGGASTASAGPQTPYTGLQKEAYGPLTTTPVVYCDPAANMRLAPGSGTTTSDVATDITALIAKPFGAINTIDDGIAQENLQHNFAIPGDVGQANVALIESTDDVVAFWYTQLVKLPEVQAAATEYCGRRNRTAVYAGSASRCPTPQVVNQLRMNHQSLTVRNTYVISSFNCTPAPADTPKSATAATRKHS